MLQNRAAKAVISLFNSLPAKSKPRLRDDVHEWVPLSGILVEDTHDNSLRVVSLATGNKVLPASKVSLAQGRVLHDCHAEILAIRGFNVFLTSECKRVLCDTEYASPFLERNNSSHGQQPFVLKKGLKLHMFSTEAPCGDASMENIQSMQEDGRPWVMAKDVKFTEADALNGGAFAAGRILRGRGYFSELGCVRTKPGRNDSPPTLSKSCSDKLATKQLLSLLQTPVFLIISPSTSAYLCSLMLPQASYNEISCKRAFGSSGRLKPLAGGIPPNAGGYEMRFFDVVTCSQEATCDYSFSRDVTEARATGSNIATILLPLSDPPYHETLINGVLSGRKAFSGKGVSALSKRSMWNAVMSVSELLKDSAILKGQVSVDLYEELKAGEDGPYGAQICRRGAKKKIREVLAGNSWTRNGGNAFRLAD